MGAFSVDLKSSICTDTPTGSDVYPFEEAPTQVIQNTGIERNGGIAAQFEQESTLSVSPALATVIAKDGSVIQIDSSNNVVLNGTTIGNVGTLCVYARGVLPGSYVDAVWTKNATILGLKQAGLTFTIDEYDPYNATVTNTRSVTFASAPYAATPGNFGTLGFVASFVRYVDMAYADNQEFILFRGLSNNSGTFLQESGTTSATMGTGATALGSFANFAFRFQAGSGSYAWGPVGYNNSAASASYWASGTIVNGGASIPMAQFCIIDRWIGQNTARAVFSNTWTKTTSGSLSTMVVGGCVVGYTSAGTLSFTPSFIAATGLATATTFSIVGSLSVVGPGQSEATGTLSSATTLPFTYLMPYYLISTSVFTNNINIGKDTLASYFGRLTCLATNTTSLVEWRSCSISSIPAFLSAAINDNNTSGDYSLGVPITNNGEYDPYHVPHIDDNPTSGYSRILYRFNGVYHWAEVRSRASSPSSPQLQRLADNTYLVNTLSPVNVVDLTSKSLIMGINDFNGRMLVTAGTATSSAKYASVVQGKKTNSFDVGDRITVYGGTPVLGASNIAVPFGIKLPSCVDRFPQDGGINVYYNDTYIGTEVFVTTAGVPVVQVINDLIGALYVPTTVEPFAMGYTMTDNTVSSDIETLFLGVGVAGVPDIVYDYAGYEIGNDLAGIFTSFFLYGNRYIFDGNMIWLTTFSGALYSTKIQMAPAVGMTLIAVSPTAAYFLSSFDNSLYLFDGGRSLTKVKRMNDLRNSSGTVEAIQNGVYNVRDNTLLLQTANTFVWARDGIFSQTNKKANQTSTVLYDTQSGIQIANNTSKWIYSYSTLTSSTVVALDWQSSYYGYKANELSTAMNWVVTIFSPDGRISAPLTLRAHSFDQEGYATQTTNLTINPNDWDGLGFYRARIQPKNRKVLASSIEIKSTKHLVITDVTLEYGDEAQAAIRPSRST